MVSTIGAFIIAVSMLIFVINMALSWRRHRKHPVPVGPDPWDARSLEWMMASPTPAHNFDQVPTVSHLDEFWHRKYGEDDHRQGAADGGHRGCRPEGRRDRRPPALAVVLAARCSALALPIIGYGMIFNLGVAAVGGVLLVLSAFGWGYEPADDPEAHHAHAAHGDGHGGNGHEGGNGSGGNGAATDGDGGGSGETAAVGAASGAASEEEASSDD